MFGMEKKEKPLFQFDLEIELKQDEKKKQQLLELVEKKTQEIKAQIRQGAAEKDFDQYGVLLHGFAALAKVLKRIPKNTSKGRPS